jgi:hypothetical protein
MQRCERVSWGHSQSDTCHHYDITGHVSLQNCHRREVRRPVFLQVSAAPAASQPPAHTRAAPHAQRRCRAV